MPYDKTKMEPQQKLIFAALIGTLILGFVGSWTFSGAVPSARAEGLFGIQATKSFTMQAKRFEFVPSTITVTKGDNVELTVTSMDVTHGIFISEFGVNETIPAGESKTITFTASEAGTFSMVCSSFCGSGHGSMSANLIVQDQAPQPNEPDTAAPSIPQNVAGNASSSFQIDLAWSASEDNVGVKSYVVYRNGTSVLTPATPSGSDTSLTPGTKYNYQVTALDAAGNESEKSSLLAITTPSLKDETSPTVSNVLETQVSTTSAIIKWTSDEKSVGQVEYGVRSGSFTAATPWDATYSTSHSAELSGLTTGTSYFYRIKNTDESSNLGISTEHQFVTASETEEVADRNAPKISDISSKDIQETQATVTFTTNEDAKALVEFGTTTGNYTETLEDANFSASHELILRELTNGTIYFFRVKATDGAGNFEFSSQQLFTTLSPSLLTTEEEKKEDEGSADESASSDDQSSEEKKVNSNTNASLLTVAAPKLEFVQVNESVIPVLLPEAEGEAETFAFTVPEGEPILFKGTSIPDATITLRISSDPIEVTTISDASGNWSYTLTQALEAGDHTVEIAVRSQDGEKSSFSDPLRFQVEAIKTSSSTLTNEPSSTPASDSTRSSLGIVVAIVLVLLAIAFGLHYMKRRLKPPASSKE